MNTNQNQVISLLSDALTSVLEGQNGKATKNLVSAIKLLNGTTASPTTLVVKRGRPAGSKNKKKSGGYVRLKPEQISAINFRLSQGESPADISRALGVNYRTVYNYHVRSKSSQTV